MYLLKQWRESRILSGLAILALLLLFAGVIKIDFMLGHIQVHHADDYQKAAGATVAFVIATFYMEGVLVSFWAWLIASIGAGKNLGEDSGSFLFTRPRRRAWFLWNDWAFALAQIAAIILVANLIFAYWTYSILTAIHRPAVLQLDSASGSITVPAVFLLISITVLLFAGLIYGLTYFSTVLIKRTAGVMLGAGIFLGYLILDGILHHYYAIRLPSPIMNVFNFSEHGLKGISNNLGINIAIRAAVMLAFPFAAQLILDHSEI